MTPCIYQAQAINWVNKFHGFRYIKVVEPFIDKPVVKILTGVRRCGKSTIFRMIKEELIRRGVSGEDIIEKRYTEMDIPEDITAQQMYQETRLRQETT